MESNGWITDRLPTKNDADCYEMVLVWMFTGRCYARIKYYYVGTDVPWMPIADPPPYVKQRWKPKKGEEFWCNAIDGVGLVHSASEFNKEAIDIGNCFQTRKEAEEVFKKFKQLLKEHHDGK